MMELTRRTNIGKKKKKPPQSEINPRNQTVKKLTNS